MSRIAHLSYPVSILALGACATVQQAGLYHPLAVAFLFGSSTNPGLEAYSVLVGELWRRLLAADLALARYPILSQEAQNGRGRELVPRMVQMNAIGVQLPDPTCCERWEQIQTWNTLV